MRHEREQLKRLQKAARKGSEPLPSLTRRMTGHLYRLLNEHPSRHLGNRKGLRMARRVPA